MLSRHCAITENRVQRTSESGRFRCSLRYVLIHEGHEELKPRRTRRARRFFIPKLIAKSQSPNSSMLYTLCSLLSMFIPHLSPYALCSTNDTTRGRHKLPTSRRVSDAAHRHRGRLISFVASFLRWFATRCRFRCCSRNRPYLSRRYLRQLRLASSRKHRSGIRLRP